MKVSITKGIPFLIILLGIALFWNASHQRNRNRLAVITSGGNNRVPQLGDLMPDISVQCKSIIRGPNRLKPLLSSFPKDSFFLVHFTSKDYQVDTAYEEAIYRSGMVNHLRVVLIHLEPEAESAKAQAATKDARAAITTCSAKESEGFTNLGLSSETPSASFFLDSSGKVLFASAFPLKLSDVNKRLLIERFILGHTLPPKLADGSELIGISLLDILEGNLRQPDLMAIKEKVSTDDITLIFFRANCTTCGLQNYATLVANRYERNKKRKGHATIGLFSSTFDIVTLDPLIREASRIAPGALFRSIGLIDSLENPLLVGRIKENELLVFEVKKKSGVITNVFKYAKWLEVDEGPMVASTVQ